MSGPLARAHRLHRGTYGRLVPLSQAVRMLVAAGARQYQTGPRAGQQLATARAHFAARMAEDQRLRRAPTGSRDRPLPDSYTRSGIGHIPGSTRRLPPVSDF